MHTAGGVESRETNAHGEDAFSVAGDHVLLASDHEGIIVLEQWQPLTQYYSLYKYIMRQSINPKSRIFQQLRISRQRRTRRSIQPNRTIDAGESPRDEFTQTRGHYSVLEYARTVAQRGP